MGWRSDIRGLYRTLVTVMPRDGLLVLGLGLAIFGALVLYNAVGGSRVAFGFFGLALTAGGLYLINWRLRRHLFDNVVDSLIADNQSASQLIRDRRWWGRLVGWLAFLTTGVALVLLAGVFSWPLIWVIYGVAFATIAVGPMAQLFRVFSRFAPWWWLGAGLATIVVGFAGLLSGSAASSALPLLGVAAVLIGLGAYKAGLENLVVSNTPAGRPRESSRAVAVSVVGVLVFGAGVLGMTIAVRGAVVPIGVVGALLIFVSLIALALSWPEVDLWPVDRLAVLVIGGLFLLAAVFVSWSSGLGDIGAWLVTAGLAAVGWTIVRRGEGVLLGVLVGMAVVWSVVDRTVDQPPDPHPEASARIVAFGDSYISGEGATTFFADTSQVGANQNECRRSPTAYPYRVADSLGMGLDFYACSGARTVNVIRDGVGQMPNSPTTVLGAEVQMAALPPPDQRENIEIALVSIGGNDARFSQIAKGCLLPGTCDELRELWLGNVENLGPSMREVYRQIKEELPGVPVIAMPYPLMITEEGCGWSQFDTREHAFIFEFVAVLNEQVRVSAAQEGVHFFQPGLFAFEDRRICDGDSPDDALMNFLTIQPPEGDFLARLNPQTWIHGSMHPKPDGHEATARALGPYIEQRLAEIDGLVGDERIERANPEPIPTARLNVLGIRGPEPFPVNPADYELAMEDCETTAPDPFATRVLVFDEDVPQLDGEIVVNVPAVPIRDADDRRPVCLSTADGSWRSVEPTEDGAVRSDDGVLYITAEVPDEGSSQAVLYRDRQGVQRVRILELCSRNTSCPSTVDGWTNDQLTQGARQAAPAVVLAVLAGWLLAIGTMYRPGDLANQAATNRAP